MGPIEESDPEVARIRAVLESRMLGVEPHPIRIGRFAVIERVGAGGMGVVFAAFDPRLDRKVAIKLLSHGADDEGERTRLVREAKALAELAHPNVVGIFEVGEHHGRVFVATEYVQGRTLNAWLSEPGRGWRETLAMFVQAGRGLAAAHAAGIVHRDFKPDNVLVGDDGRARVADFGLARATIEADDPRPRVDANADQFAFCISVWEALAGERPFVGDTSLFEEDAAGEPRRPPRAAMPSWLESALRRGLASDVDERHRSMDSLLAVLERGAGRRRRAWLAGGVAFVALASVGGWVSAGAPTPIWFQGDLGPRGNVESSESDRGPGITVAPGGDEDGGGMITVVPHLPEASRASAFMIAYTLVPDHRPELALVELMQLADQPAAAPEIRGFAIGGSSLMDTVVFDHVPPGDYTLCVRAARARWRDLEDVLGYECRILSIEIDGDTRRLDVHPLGR